MNVIEAVLGGPLAAVLRPSIERPGFERVAIDDIVFAAFAYSVSEFYGLDCRDVVSLVAASPEYVNPARPVLAADFELLADCIGDALLPPDVPLHPFTVTLH